MFAAMVQIGCMKNEPRADLSGHVSLELFNPLGKLTPLAVGIQKNPSHCRDPLACGVTCLVHKN